MTTLVIALDDGLLVAGKNGGGWRTVQPGTVAAPRSLAVDRTSGILFCGTADAGLWRSRDGGESWEESGAGIEQRQITAVAVDGQGIAYAGTEPSRFYRSQDGGDSWQLQPGLTELPSSGDWAFPPRPSTHHVRWIEPDPNRSGQLYVAIEAGALVTTPDGGDSWQDRVPGGPYDTHTLASHPDAPGRLYSAAGDGYFESHDSGQTWQKPREGIHHWYFVGLAVSPADPNVIIASASQGPPAAYNPRIAETVLYRRAGDEPWEIISEGLPPARGMTINLPATHPDNPDTFYSANNHGLFRSDDQGRAWQSLDLDWPDPSRQQRVYALVVV